ncbi:interferon alpha/beta receptor 1 isoform X2 [Rhinatrema bivittatum]|uniref:interferon alpha/beta receptor 1 isoform X2 n=1 Tax=Rhinatrema bivittatum TaxID=194408 RepID=UPI00112AA5FD|nr:interferon alpha/beta receptor 1 isoform X2 [Rhinatrema bivittatum]
MGRRRRWGQAEVAAAAMVTAAGGSWALQPLLLLLSLCGLCLAAEIGPPSDVQVEAIDGLIRINILAPGSTDKTPMWEASDFSYLVELRKNGSNEQKQIKLASNNERIDKLSPNTTYCLRVKAQLNAGEKEGSFSPEYCVHTESADANVLPRPENVRIHALNTHFVLKWDWDEAYGENVTFLVECCRAYDKKYMASNCWHAVPSCKEVTTSECDLSSEIWFEGTYEFRVRAISGTEERAWSKEITCNPSKDTEIGPPSKVEINLINDSIEIKISHPGEDTNKSMKDIQGFYDLSYRIFVWKNTSDKWEKCFEDEHTLYTLPVSELNPETYCLKVQAFSQMSNKSGHFSAIKCITTEAGNNPVVLVVAVFFLQHCCLQFYSCFLLRCL